MTPWRQGRKVPQNVYEGDKPIAQFHDAETAARVVEAVNNAARAHAEGLEAGLREAWLFLAKEPLGDVPVPEMKRLMAGIRSLIPEVIK